MSNQSPLGGRNRGMFPSLPRGEVVATFETYLDAQQAVDVLARADFPVSKLSIVGSDLKSVERVTGKLTWGRVALAGAASGAWLGLFFGLLLVIFAPATNLGFVMAALLIGAGFGMLFGIVSYAINRRRRDFTSVMQVIATSYQVLVDPDLVNRARNLLDGSATSDVDAAPAAPAVPTRHPSDPPPRYGLPAEPPSEDPDSAPDPR
ncbi:MAG: general stress protein [Microbacteriaceae bacterium]